MKNQNNLEYIKDQMQRGLITAEQANIEKVRMERFCIIKNKLPQSVRKSLMVGVKSGLLKRKMKTDKNPEYFYHPNFEYLAKQEIYKQQCNLIKSLKSICL